MATWNSGFFECCSGPDCGTQCCIQWYCCPCCVYGDINEKAGLGECAPCGIFFFFFSPCAPCKLAIDVNKKYDIGDSTGMICLKGWCCPCCLQFQAANEIMFREGLKYKCAGTEVMER